MILPLALALVLMNGNDDSADRVRLPGSELSVEEATKRSDIIVVSEVAGDGVTIELKPSRSLKGGTGSRELSVSLPDSMDAPKPGEAYIFFVEEPDFLHLRCIKVLRATPENLEAVAEAQRREARLPGSDKRLYEAVRDSDIIAVAEVLALGQGSMGPPASTSYGPTKLKLVRSLKGDAEELPSPTFHVMTVPPEWAENVPAVGVEYLFFIETTPPHAIRVLLPTEENVKAVQGELRKLAEFGRLRGKWVLHQDREDGKPGHLNRNIRPTFLVIRGGRATLSGEAADPIWDAFFTLEPGETPKAIDFKLLQGPDEGKLRLGIYAVEPGQALKLCLAKPGQDRPKDFETKPGDGRTLNIFGSGPPGIAATRPR